MQANINRDLQKSYKNLPYEKVLELVQSIPSLNECLDKKEFQKKVNYLPDEHLTKIENEIAEEILQKYASYKWQYQSERNKYFKSKLVELEDRISQNEEKYQHKRDTLQRKSEYKKLSKRYRTILNGLQNGSVTLKDNKNDPVHRLYK